MIEPGSDRFAATPRPPYYAVIFTSRRTAADPDGYGRMAEELASLALEQPGCLGLESVRDADGIGITVSYWASEAAIRAWKHVAIHLAAQRAGREKWYEHYELRVARVERAYSLATSPLDGLRPPR